MAIPILGIALSVLGLVVDFASASYVDGKVAQFEQMLSLIESGASLGDFVSQCWLVLLLLFFIFWAGLSMAFPKRGYRH